METHRPRIHRGGQLLILIGEPYIFFLPIGCRIVQQDFRTLGVLDRAMQPPTSCTISAVVPSAKPYVIGTVSCICYRYYMHDNSITCPGPCNGYSWTFRYLGQEFGQMRCGCDYTTRALDFVLRKMYLSVFDYIRQ